MQADITNEDDVSPPIRQSFILPFGIRTTRFRCQYRNVLLDLGHGLKRLLISRSSSDNPDLYLVYAIVRDLHQSPLSTVHNTFVQSDRCPAAKIQTIHRDLGQVNEFLPHTTSVPATWSA
jgi:hypothetical protein